jgi:hypothetical protein
MPNTHYVTTTHIPDLSVTNGEHFRVVRRQLKMYFWRLEAAFNKDFVGVYHQLIEVVHHKAKLNQVFFCEEQ